MDEEMIGKSGSSKEIKKKRIIRIIILSAIVLVISAIIVTVVLLTKKSDENEGDNTDNTNNTPSQEETITILYDNTQIKKPNHTNKEYQIIQLDKSKYKFMLIKDPKSLNGALEIRTNLGFDTEVIDGFAHYAEHTFFGGTERVTELDLFSIIGQFNEWLNAYTWHEETVFQLFGSNYTYDTLLEYFSDCIQNPKLDKTYLVTEINAVNSEYDNNNITFYTYQDIYREYSNPEHPFRDTITSHVGSNFTLGNHTADELKYNLENYFKFLFNPENSVYLLYSSLSFEEMSNKAKKFFNFKLGEPTQEFKDRINKKINALDKPLFLEGTLGNIAIFNHMRQTPVLIIAYHFSENNGYVDIMNILNYLFSGIHEGSLLKFLYDNYYISNFYMFNDGNLKNEQLINMVFDLTEKGLDNFNKIIEAFFAMINVIKGSDNLEKLINNAKIIEETIFKNKEETPAQFPDDVDNIVFNYHFYGPKNMVSGNPSDILYTKQRVLEIINDMAPSKSFIFLDTKKNIVNDYITSTEIKYLKNYNVPYRVNKISENLITKLNSIKSIEGYNFKIREENHDYTKLFDTTEKPCYEKSPNNCSEYNEYDANNKSSEYKPYVIKNENNIFSIVKIDRSYGIPFVKGYVKIILDETKFKEYVNTPTTQALYYFLLYSFNYKFSFSTLYNGGSSISLTEELNSYFEFTFSTYNDLLDNIVQYIIDFFKEPIDEKSFNIFKEKYYLSNVVNYDNPHVELRTDLLNLFKRFISVDTFTFKPFDDEIINNLKYSDFQNLFENLKNIKKELKYLTHGDISVEQSKNTTELLSKLITYSRISLKSSSVKNVELPEGTSVLYSLTSPNPYQRQGATLVMYEFDSNILEQMTIYSYCAADILFDYIRTKRGSGYAVKVQIHNILNKNYLFIYCLGKVYSPEKMDRLVNEAIEFSFNSTKCNVPLIRQHLKNKEEIKGYAEDRFQELLNYINPQVNNLNNEKIFEDDNMTYESIIDNVKEVVIKKVKRVSILYHRGDISDEDLIKQKNELDADYYLNTTIKNDRSENIKYLEKFVKNN